jgi:hypothetical protein
VAHALLERYEGKELLEYSEKIAWRASYLDSLRASKLVRELVTPNHYK